MQTDSNPYRTHADNQVADIGQTYRRRSECIQAARDIQPGRKTCRMHGRQAVACAAMTKWTDIWNREWHREDSYVRYSYTFTSVYIFVQPFESVKNRLRAVAGKFQEFYISQVSVCSKKSAYTLFGYRCNQLPLIERSPQWLSGPSSPLSVTAGPPVGYRTRFKWCSDAQYFYSTFSIDDINAQSGWSLKTEKIRINNMYTLTLFIQYGIYFWHELAYTLYYISLKLNSIIGGTSAYFLLTLTCISYLSCT